jgi:hypothetical protein
MNQSWTGLLLNQPDGRQSVTRIPPQGSPVAGTQTARRDPGEPPRSVREKSFDLT